MSLEKWEEFIPSSKTERMEFIDFGDEGDEKILPISDWTVYKWTYDESLRYKETEAPYLLDDWGRACKISAKGFQGQLKEFWGKKCTLIVQRWIPKAQDGKRATTLTWYKVKKIANKPFTREEALAYFSKEQV
jgi:hypothetical protein